MNSKYIRLALQCVGLPLCVFRVSSYRFRDCALKWHPDRHLGDDKAMAEANFKTANAAYEGMLERCQD